MAGAHTPTLPVGWPGPAWPDLQGLRPKGKAGADLQVEGSHVDFVMVVVVVGVRLSIVIPSFPRLSLLFSCYCQCQCSLRGRCRRRVPGLHSGHVGSTLCRTILEILELC